MIPLPRRAEAEGLDGGPRQQRRVRARVDQQRHVRDAVVAVQVTDDEMQRALIEYVRGVPADQQRQVFEFYRDNPNALANLRAPLFEEKVVDHMLTQIDVTDKQVTKEELLAEDEDEAAAKPAKKTASKKKEAKAEAADEAGEAKKKAAPKKKPAAKKAEE